MSSSITRSVAAGLILALTACGGGGGGDRAPGVEPGPPPPGGPVPPEPNPAPPAPGTIDAGSIADTDEVAVAIDGITVSSPPTLTFTVTVNDTLTVTGLTVSNVRFGLAELVPEPNFEIDSWQSFIETQEDPVCRSQADVDASNNACTTFTTETDPALIPATALQVQDPVAVGKVVEPHATTETSGTLMDNGDGSWSYTYSTDIGDPAAIANMVRACMQFSLNAPTDNACIDFVPQDLIDPAIGAMATSLDPGFYTAYRSRQIVSEATCNTCHAQLALHGGGRKATDYCVSCHNPGSTDAHSANPVDFKVMIHRIHNARNLDSVVDGTPYKIWGFRNNEHDFSHVSYPQRVLNCTRCHAGQQDVDNAAAAGLPAPDAVVTPDGYNWASKPNPVTCLSCHEDAEDHVADRDSCVGCHGPGEFAAVEEMHRDLLEESGLGLALSIDSVTQTGANENPIVTFSATRDGTPIDLLDPDDFEGSLRIRIAWDAATEYLNSGGTQPPITVELADAVDIGGGQFQIDTGAAGQVPVPPGIDTLGINGFLNETLPEGTASATSPDVYVASTAASPTPRRRVVDKANCNKCHRRLTMHAPGGRSVTDNPQVCVGCHTPNRASSGSSTSTAFSVAIHSLHASGIREAPYRDFDEETLQFPGNLANCETCHASGTFRLPLPLDRVPITEDPAGLFSTPIAAACRGCHDDTLAASHMASAGGAVIREDFATADAAVESCEICHGTGAIADLDVVHGHGHHDDDAP